MLQGGNYYWYIPDGLGTVRLVMDSSGTTVVSSFASDEFGRQTAVTGSPTHTFTGALGVRNEVGIDSQLLYARQRWYDPSLGRFLSQDPIGFSGGLNVYAYVGNNPIHRVDPSGLRPPQAHSMDPIDNGIIRDAIKFIRNQGGEYVDVANELENTTIYAENPFGDIGHTFNGEIFLNPNLNRFDIPYIAREDDIKSKYKCGKISREQYKKLLNKHNAEKWEAIVQTASTLVHEHVHLPQPTLLTSDLSEPPAYNAEERFLRKVIRSTGNANLSARTQTILNSTLQDAARYR